MHPFYRLRRDSANGEMGRTFRPQRGKSGCRIGHHWNMRMQSVVGAVDVAVSAALAGTPWARDPTLRAQDDDDARALPNQEVRLVWCGSYEAVRTLYLDLPQAQGNQTGGCVDLWVHIDANGLLSQVDFEGQSLPDTFRLLHRRADAEEFDGLLGLPADAVAPQLARHLVDVLRAARTTGV